MALRAELSQLREGNGAGSASQPCSAGWPFRAAGLWGYTEARMLLNGKAMALRSVRCGPEVSETVFCLEPAMSRITAVSMGPRAARPEGGHLALPATFLLLSSGSAI